MEEEWQNQSDKPADHKEPVKGYRGWIGTWNNYTEQDYHFLCNFPARHKIVGKEVGKQGTPHLQFTLYFDNQKTLKALAKKLKSKTHIEPAWNYQHCSIYCKKQGDFYEDGQPPVNVSVNRWADIQNDVVAGLTWEELISKYPEEAIKYLSGLRSYYETLRPKFTFNIQDKYGSYLPWQANLLEEIRAPPSDRTIIWYVDEVGGKGKTDMATHLVSSLGWIRLTNGKSSDIALAWNGENVIFDYSRSQQEHINYGIIEDLKNGQVFSGKYQSVSKVYRRPYVVVFANFHPDQGKMSLDRWDIRVM